MAIKRLNHAVLYVRDAQRSAAFYRDVLGFNTVAEFAGGVFLQAPQSTNDHDIAFFTIRDHPRPSTAGRGTVGLYHLAWEVGTLGELADLRRSNKKQTRWLVPTITWAPRASTQRIHIAFS